MIDLSRRIDEPELLDLGVPDEEARASLHDLRRVNRWLSNRGALLRAVRRLLAGLQRPSLLDVGCGSADVTAAMAAAGGGSTLAVGLDIKLLHLREVGPPVLPVQGDVQALPFAPASFDVVTASLFLHHFSEEQLPRLLRSLYDLARRGLVVNDLRRARLPYLFGKLAFPWLFRSHVSVNDGLLSIRRGFTLRELAAAFSAAGIRVRIRRSFPYRLLAVARK